MKTIWKFPFTPQANITIIMPARAQIIAVDVQHEQPCIWAIVEPRNPSAARHFVLRGTGHPFDGREGEYVGTFQMHNGDLVFHLFEAI